MAHIRQLTTADLADYRAIRLEALARHPEAFGTSAPEEAAKSDAELRQVLMEHVVFGGYLSGLLEGIAALRQGAIDKERHKSVLWGMYVREAARGSGLAGEIVDAALEYSSNHVIQVQLVVGVDNAKALKLYKRRGFQTYGRAPRALKLGERYLDEFLMVRYLDDPV